MISGRISDWMLSTYTIVKLQAVDLNNSENLCGLEAMYEWRCVLGAVKVLTQSKFYSAFMIICPLPYVSYKNIRYFLTFIVAEMLIF